MLYTLALLQTEAEIVEPRLIDLARDADDFPTLRHAVRVHQFDPTFILNCEATERPFRQKLRLSQNPYPHLFPTPVRLFGSDAARLIRQCESPSCTLYFIDTSRRAIGDGVPCQRAGTKPRSTNSDDASERAMRSNRGASSRRGRALTPGDKTNYHLKIEVAHVGSRYAILFNRAELCGDCMCLQKVEKGPQKKLSAAVRRRMI